VVKFDAQVLLFKFYRKVLRKAVKIVEKWLKVLKVLTGCQGAEVPGCWVPALTPLISQQSIVIIIGSH
jgi:hypothetical protein